MSIISKVRKQKAVLWKKEDMPNLMGEDVYGDPVVIDCRWTDELNIVANEQGQQVSSQHKVFVDRELDLGDLLYKGDTSPIRSTEQPVPDTSIKRVVSKKTIPNLRNTETLYIVHL